MIICAQCGERNADGTVFCARCGAYLEWEGEKVPERPGSASRGRTERGTRPHQAELDATVVMDAPAPTDGASADQPTEVVQAAPHQPSPVGGARQPETMRPRRMRPRPQVARQIPTGSLICGACGMPNQSERRFCARCGAPLAGARVVRKPPWWQQLLGRERVYEAGYRKKVPARGRRRASRLGRIGTTLLLLAGVGGVGILAGPQRGLVMKGIHSVQNRVQKPQQVRPSAARASVAAKGHPAAAAVDGAKNTYWAAPLGGATRNAVPWVRAEFAAPIHLVAVGITPGMSFETPAFVAGTRPTKIEVSVDTDSEPVVQRFDIPDVAGFHKLKLDARGARTVQVAVLASRGKHASIRTAIAELEFYVPAAEANQP